MNFGVIGYSEGNGHPFSFSAILNGYDSKYLDLNPIQPINNYLLQKSESEFFIDPFTVTHVWTQNKELSNCISKFSKIPNVVENFEEMIPEVEGLLLLRDDLHFEISKPFLEAGKFVFIDKPLSLKEDELEFFRPYLENSQLMSCSGLRYAPKVIEFLTTNNIKPKFAFCTTFHSFPNYGIHILESMAPIFGTQIKSIEKVPCNNSGNIIHLVHYENDHYLIIHSSIQNFSGISARLFFDDNNPIQIDFNDNFNSFKNTLLSFKHQISTKIPSISPKETLDLMKALKLN